jgi:hypothetical protein
MKLSGLHLLLTQECNFECEHCFVWGSPRQSGTMTLRSIREIMRQAESLGTIEWIYFEGGEPFLYYAILLRGVRMAQRLGFRVGVVSNAYWGTDTEDALEWLGPLAGLIQDLSISSDLFHSVEPLSQAAQRACAAAAELGIPAEVIRIAQPEAANAASGAGQLPEGESALMYRGRSAARRWSGRAGASLWSVSRGELRRRLSSVLSGPTGLARTIRGDPHPGFDVWGSRGVMKRSRSGTR